MRLDSIGNVLPGLLPATYRGIEMQILDTSSESGRRVVEYLFPGVDAAAYDDFGVAPGIVQIEAFYVGDDYRAHARKLEAAFNTAGTGTLIHPWFGPMTVIMMDPAIVSFSVRELRVVRISATFKKVPTSALSGFDGSFLVSAVASVVRTASALAASVEQRVISNVRTSSVSRSFRLVSAAIGDVLPPSGSGRLLPRMKTIMATAVPNSPVAFDTLSIRTAGLFAEASETPAVAPAAEAAASVRPSVQSVLSVSMALADALAAQLPDAPSDADRSLLASSAAHYLAQGVAQSAYATYQSRREALAFRARATDALDALMAGLDGIASPLFQVEGSALGRAARELQSAVIADISEAIGRLPDVLTFSPERDLDAWLLAAHVFGDNPSRIEAGYLDIIERNRPRHPAALAAGTVEVLG